MLEFASSPSGSCRLLRICRNCWSIYRLVGSIFSPHSIQQIHDHLFAPLSAESTKFHTISSELYLAIYFATILMPCNITREKEWQDVKHWLPMSQEIYYGKEFCYFFLLLCNQNICMKVHCVYKVVAKPSPDLFPAMLSSYASPQALSLICRKVQSGNWDPQARLSDCDKMHR